MPNMRRPEDERRLLQRRRCLEELALRVFFRGRIGVQDLSGLHLLAKVRPMSVRDVGGRGRATHRRAFVSLDRVEEHLRFPQLPTRADDSQTGLLDTLTGLCFSAHHAASPPTTSSSTAGWTQMPTLVRTMRPTPI